MLGIKTAPPLAGVKWEPYALSVRPPLRQKSVWRPRTLSVPISTLPASPPIPYIHRLGNIRTHFITPLIPVNTTHNETPRLFLILPPFMATWPLPFLFLTLSPTRSQCLSPFPMLSGTHRQPLVKSPISSAYSLKAPSIFLL